MTDDVKSGRRISKLNIDFILVCLMFVFFGIVFIQSQFLSQTAGLVPKFISGAALLLCIVQIIADIRKGNMKENSQAVEAVKPIQLKWYYMLVLLISYVVSLYLLGFIPSAFLFLLITPYILKHKKLKANFILATVTTVILYFIFVEIFYVQLPDGMLFDYLF